MTPHRTRFWHAAWRLAGCLALPALLAGPAAQAQVAPAERDYDIPAGPLGSALARLAAEANVLFSADARLLDGRATRGLQGRHALQEAFARLLDGSGLMLVRDGTAYTVRAITPPALPPAAAQQPEAMLPPVIVRATPLHDESGYAARQARQPTRTDTPVQDVPQSITVITQEFIRDQAAQSLAELLRYVPGVGAAQGEGNRDTPVFRGAASTSDFLFDGIRDDVQYYRDLYNIERIEALRGPNAMAVGHGAVGGLINRVSKEPGWLERRELSLTAGAWEQRRATLDWDGLAAPDLAFRLNTMVEDSGGYRDHYGLRRFGINPVLAWRTAGSGLVTLGFEHFQDQRTADRGIPSYQGRPVEADPSTFFGNPDVSTTWIRLNAVNLQFDLDLGGGRGLRNRTRYADYDKFFQNAFAGAVRNGSEGLAVALSAHNSRTQRRNVFSQTDLTLPFELGAVRHTVLAGLELGRQSGDNRRETGYFGTSPESTTIFVPLDDAVSHLPIRFRTSPTDPYSASRARIAALYLQDQMRFGDAWQATLGLRHDRLSLDVDDLQARRALHSSDGLWSPRAGLVYQPARELSVYANYSVGHAPRAGEQFASLTPSNQSLEPEEFVNREMGVKWSPRAGLEATAALYVLDRRNVAIPEPGSATQSLTLVDGQRTRGLELSLSGRVRPGWEVMAAYTLQDSKVRSAISPLVRPGAAMPHVPRHSLAVWNRVALDERWSAGLGLDYRGSVYTSADNTVRLPGYVRADGALFYVPQPGWRWQLHVENLFDTHYYAFAHNNNNITPGAPRTLRLGLNARF